MVLAVYPGRGVMKNSGRPDTHCRGGSRAASGFLTGALWEICSILANKVLCMMEYECPVSSLTLELYVLNTLTSNSNRAKILSGKIAMKRDIS